MDFAIHLRSAVAMAGRFPVLAGVDLDVTTGEVVLLRGANGAGKSSLLRACAGLLRVAAGEAVVLGEDLVADPRAVRRRVGLLGHGGALYDDLSALDNLRFFLRASHRPAALAEPALESMGLTGRLMSTPVGSLSAGQKRRAALAVLVANQPELWLLDEPHAGLDSDHRDLLDAVVRRAVAAGATVVVSSHEDGRAEALANRVVTMGGGVVRSSQALRPVVVADRAERQRPRGLQAGTGAWPVWRDAVVVGAKDLRIEMRSRVTTTQIAPYAVLVLVLFGLAFDSNHSILSQAAPGLFWVAVLLCCLLATGRSYAIEAGDGPADGLRMSGLDPAGVFLGKAAAVALELIVLEVILGAGIVVLFAVRLHDLALLLLTAAAATVAISAAATVYGMVAQGLRVRETLLPLLVLPVMAPVLLAATQAWMFALGITESGGWRWLGLLAAFAALYVTFGVLVFATLLEQT